MVGICKERLTTTPTLVLSLQEYHVTCPVLLMYIHISSTLQFYENLLFLYLYFLNGKLLSISELCL